MHLVSTPGTPHLPDRRPPAGVPRWLWPPPGATVERVVIREVAGAGEAPTYDVRAGAAPERSHLRALQWLLFDYTREGLPPEGCAFEGEVVLDIARTGMPGGRVGHAYAINGLSLGDPGMDGARGILWRYIHDRVSAVE
jgi:hypothetical protein